MTGGRLVALGHASTVAYQITELQGSYEVVAVGPQGDVLYTGGPTMLVAMGEVAYAVRLLTED